MRMQLNVSSVRAWSHPGYFLAWVQDGRRQPAVTCVAVSGQNPVKSPALTIPQPPLPHVPRTAHLLHQVWCAWAQIT